MGVSKQSNFSIGVLVKRKNIPFPIIKDLRKELYLFLLEADIVQKNLEFLQKKNFANFDGSAGDAKCQTRCSIIMNSDLVVCSSKEMLDKTSRTLTNFQNHIRAIIQKIPTELNKLTKKDIESFKDEDLNQFLIKNNINLHIVPKDLKTLCLSYITKLTKTSLYTQTSNYISKQYLDKFRELAKIQLCEMSIEHEQKLAKSYGSLEDQKCLMQIESKKYSSGYASMTAFYPSFRLILNHMKQKEQPFLQHNIIFCSCGGLLNSTFTTWKSINNKFEPIDMNKLYFSEAIMVIVGYQYDGSFHDLKKKLEIPEHLNLINFEQIKLCSCETPKPPISKNDNIEEILLANSAQHPQFITGAEINWKELGLEESALKKEFEYLQTIPGCSINDMSEFCVRHVYASTISQVIQEDQKLPHPNKQGSLYIKANKK